MLQTEFCIESSHYIKHFTQFFRAVCCPALETIDFGKLKSPPIIMCALGSRILEKPDCFSRRLCVPLDVLTSIGCRELHLQAGDRSLPATISVVSNDR